MQITRWSLVVLMTLALGTHSGPGLGAVSHPVAYAIDTYTPVDPTSYASDPRLTVQTQQICTPSGQALIIHTLTSTAYDLPGAVNLRFTDAYSEVVVLGPGTVSGQILTWAASKNQPRTVITMSGGECLYLFPVVWLDQTPGWRQFLPFSTR